jgi:hypothetical protein
MPNLESRAAGRRSPKGASLGSLIFSQVWPHYNSTFQIGVSTFDIISQVLVPGFSMSNYFPSIKRADWDQKYAAAKELMQSRLSIPKVLIEVGAQHPLVRGTEPGEEFSARLLLAKKLFEEKTTQGLHVEIYVPGSRHMHQGVADTVSLARAGVMFLEQQGLPKENLTKVFTTALMSVLYRLLTFKTRTLVNFSAFFHQYKCIGKLSTIFGLGSCHYFIPHPR